MKQETLQEAVLAARMQVQQRGEALLPVRHMQNTYKPLSPDLHGMNRAYYQSESNTSHHHSSLAVLVVR
jgi:hypothetical protein